MGPNAGEMVREAIGSLRYGASAIEIARACNSDNTRDTIRVACFQAYLNATHTWWPDPCLLFDNVEPESPILVRLKFSIQVIVVCL